MKDLTTEELLEVEDERRRRLVSAFLHGSDGDASSARPGPFGSLLGGTILALVICLVVAMVILVQKDIASNSSTTRTPPAATPAVTATGHR